MQKKRFLLVLFLVLLPICFAQDGVDFEELSEVITPPPPPDIEGFNVFLELNDYNTKSLINDIHVNVEISTQDSIVKNLVYVDESGVLKLRLAPDTYNVILKVDDINTLGKDYYLSTGFTLIDSINNTVFLLPAGSVRGVVNDKDGSAVKDAKIKFDCSADYISPKDVSTDSFGSFKADWLPIGSCTVYAQNDDWMGSQSVSVEPSSLADIIIVLDNRILASKNNLIIAFIMTIVVIALGYHLYVRGNKKIQKQPKIEMASKLSKRSEDILKTLNKKEIQIVQFLIDSNNASTQAKIRYSTGIPKTSLSRLFQGLELKKIVSIEKIGKMKKIKLTDWFLNKE